MNTVGINNTGITQWFTTTNGTDTITTTGTYQTCGYIDVYPAGQCDPNKVDAPIQIDGKSVIALGVAAVIASPRKVSRRGFLGLRWKS